MLTPVDGGLLDNLAYGIGTSEHHRREGHNKQHLLRIGTRAWQDGILQELIFGFALLCREGSSRG